ncbi:hypothetical protein HK100_008132 [Physocladia obscura]|uniref:Uncharacterized protein n=1 Tax=Physocladia obscura TaxID=109957 RepID=A0AAD5X7X3_9FUNG|nr:hypothetical protein HK100_008132 [Physocladia obscura]
MLILDPSIGNKTINLTDKTTTIVSQFLNMEDTFISSELENFCLAEGLLFDPIQEWLDDFCGSDFEIDSNCVSGHNSTSDYLVVTFSNKKDQKTVAFGSDFEKEEFKYAALIGFDEIASLLPRQDDPHLLALQQLAARLGFDNSYIGVLNTLTQFD